MVRWLALAVVIALSPAAAADPRARIAEARRAVEDVRYDDARRLLVDALAAGGNGPAELREIYRLSAAAALVLGERDLGEQYYRRWLALDPDARLAADTSPKLREPFVAARAYMAAHGRLELRATRTPGAVEVTVRDPLGMVVALAARTPAGQLPAVAVRGRPVTLRAATPAEPIGEVVALDEHGNVMLELRLPPAPAKPPPPRERPRAQAPALVRRWPTWAIPAGVVAAAAIGFTIDGALAKRRLDDILADSSTHFFDEAEAERRRWRRDSRIATVGFALAGGLAATAAVVALLGHDEAAVTPVPGGATVSVRFKLP